MNPVPEKAVEEWPLGNDIRPLRMSFGELCMQMRCGQEKPRHHAVEALTPCKLEQIRSIHNEPRNQDGDDLRPFRSFSQER